MNNQWPTITDEAGRALLGRAGDLRARFLLNGLALSLLKCGGKRFRSGVTILEHAERYLSDRAAYELQPHPFGEVSLNTIPVTS